ncbi:hypothetical protein MCAP1_001481 [Malassezia caprae]|uniref:E3 ubiquitin-protein ligase listerin n=1 Tax=Malassezia caprae TaxID=1381934 RepID=A0AAF0E5F9_9BASI|nr:hypothetical protein MCAP1_001481 [Malassezia caprae]
MGKGKSGKTSATAGTRKKHAAAAAAKRGESDEATKSRTASQARTDSSGKKLSKKERKQLAKKKAYKPPPKPPQPPPYPLDSMGLASLLPADLVVLLRKALKKDIVTRVRTLEGLLAWIQGAPSSSDDGTTQPISLGERNDALVLMLPCWVFLFPRLALSPSQRLRQLTLQVHSELLHFPVPYENATCIREELLSPMYMEPILGYWGVMSFDTSRSVARLGSQLWKESVRLEPSESDSCHLVLDDYVSVLLEHMNPILCSDMPVASLAQLTPSLQITPASKEGAEFDAKSRDDTNVDENAEEMNGRLVAGALGLLQWVAESSSSITTDDLAPLVSSSQLWTALLPKEAAEDGQTVLGGASPVARQRAWAWLGYLDHTHTPLLDQNLGVIARAAFSSAWKEKLESVISSMLATFLPLLKRRPDAWLLQASSADSEDSDSDDSNEEAEESGDKTAVLPAFMQWIQNVAPRAPAICFPAILVILSTMPEDLLPRDPTSMQTWVGILLNTAEQLVLGVSDQRTWHIFTSTVCECAEYFVQQILRRNDTDPRTVQEVSDILTSELENLWTTWIASSTQDTPEAPIRTIPSRIRVRMAQEIGKFIPRMDVHSHDIWVLRPLVALFETFVAQADLEADGPVAIAMLAESAKSAAAELQDALERMTRTLFERLLDPFVPSHLPLVTHLLHSPLCGRMEAMGLSDRLDMLASDVVPSHLGTDVSVSDAQAFYLAYMALGSQVESAWNVLFRTAAQTPTTALPLLVGVAAAAPEPPATALVQTWHEDIAPAVASDPYAWHSLLEAPRTLTNASMETHLLQALVQAAQDQPTKQFEAWDTLATWVQRDPVRTQRFVEDPALAPLASDLFHAAFLTEAEETGAPRSLWAQLTAHAGSRATALYEQAVEALRVALESSDVPLARLSAAARALPDMYGRRVCPTASDLQDAAHKVALSAPSPLLSHTDPIVSIVTKEAPVSTESLARLARVVEMGLAMQADQVAPPTTLLPPIVLTALVLEDALLTGDQAMGLALSGASPSTWVATAQQQLVRYVHAVTRLLSTVTANLRDAWHNSAAVAMGRTGSDDPLLNMFQTLWQLAKETESVMYARLFARLLTGVLSMSSATLAEAERWVRAGMSLRQPSLPLSRALLAATTLRAFDSPAHDRWRNELAATLTGISAARAQTEGVPLLQALRCATAPPESGKPLLPTHRAVQLAQVIQRWIESEEEYPQDVLALSASVLTELAPVLQSVPGRHLDGMLMLAHESLETLDLAHVHHWPALNQSLHLIDTLYDLQSNELVSQALQAQAETIHGLLSALLLDLCQNAVEHGLTMGPITSEGVDLLVRLVQTHVPATAFASPDDQQDLIKFVGTPSLYAPLQVAALRLYSAATQERVREQVVEMSLGSLRSESTVPELDPALLDRLRATAPLTPALWQMDERERQSRVFAFLLQWLALLDHFMEASLALRTLFASTLKQYELTGSVLLPSLFALIGGAPRAIPALDASRWSMEEVDLDQLDPAQPRSLQVLAAHVYVRTLVHVPTQVRDWWLGIRDRQLSMFVSHFTVKFCTPLLAERELRHLRQPSALAQLQDEAMAVKVLSSNEVVATYTVDEHPMEIGVRLPPDYPLHGVEIRDIKRVGVSEAQWRAWLLAVQQLLSGKNGLIFDALSLFKKNAEAKFQGYEGAECAICYSIISPTDETLPNKPCKTCKHKFHVGQYKRGVYVSALPLDFMSA